LCVLGCGEKSWAFALMILETLSPNALSWCNDVLRWVEDFAMALVTSTTLNLASKLFPCCSSCPFTAGELDFLFCLGTLFGVLSIFRSKNFYCWISKEVQEGFLPIMVITLTRSHF
jgi:hypothetical protein